MKLYGKNKTFCYCAFVAMLIGQVLTLYATNLLSSYWILRRRKAHLRVCRQHTMKLLIICKKP